MCEWGKVTCVYSCSQKNGQWNCRYYLYGGMRPFFRFLSLSKSTNILQSNQSMLLILNFTFNLHHNILHFQSIVGFSLKRALFRLKKAHSTNRRETVSSWVMPCNDNARTTTTDTGIASLGQHFWADNVVSKPFESFLTPSPDHSVVSPTGWLESDWSPQLVAVFTKKTISIKVHTQKK